MQRPPDSSHPLRILTADTRRTPQSERPGHRKAAGLHPSGRHTRVLEAVIDKLERSAWVFSDPQGAERSAVISSPGHLSHGPQPRTLLLSEHRAGNDGSQWHRWLRATTSRACPSKAATSPSSVRSVPRTTRCSRQSRSRRIRSCSGSSRMETPSRPRSSRSCVDCIRDAVVIADTDADALEAATLAAMSAGPRSILGARLPADLVGRRVGTARPAGRCSRRRILARRRQVASEPRARKRQGLCASRPLLLPRCIWSRRRDPRRGVRGEEEGRRPAAARPLPAHARKHRHAGNGRSLGRNHRHGATSGLVRPRRAHLADAVLYAEDQAALHHGALRLRVRLPARRRRRGRAAQARPVG